MQLGGLSAWARHRNKQTGKFYCYKNLLEVRSPYQAIGVIGQGDSGAPVCIPHGSGTAWCGMIVASDTYQGYAMFAESVQEWWQGQGYELSVARSEPAVTVSSPGIVAPAH
jgi:hypothetical protein